MNRRKRILVSLAVSGPLGYLLLSIPPSAPSPPAPAGAAPFRWDQDAVWLGLQERFEAARGQPPGPELPAQLARLDALLDELEGSSHSPQDPLLEDLEAALFALGPTLAAAGQGAALGPRHERLRAAVKRQSQIWDLGARPARERLYRLLYGSRMLLEEVALQGDGSAFSLGRGAEVPSVTPSVEVAGVRVHSGDLLLTRGGAPTSALIARGNDFPGNFSHVALVHVSEDGVATVVESLIETGVVTHDVDAFMADHKLRILLLRVRPDLPSLQDDPQLPHRVAQRALNEATTRHVPYDFAMDWGDPAQKFCSEVASSAYAEEGITLWQGLTTMSTPGVVSWLAAFGVEHFETHGPSDLEYDPHLRVVVEWRDPEALWHDHVANAVIDAMLEGAESGERLDYPGHLLAPARVAKLFSWGLNLIGRRGPIPEGMSAAQALTALRLEARHAALQAEVLRRAAAFQEEKGYRPPYWTLVELARACCATGERG